jgi:ankyrin repeat protein
LLGEFIDAAVENQDKARQLLSTHPDLLHARWLHGETVLHFLTIEGYIDGVRFLARNGADVNAPNEFVDVPLLDAASLGNDEVAEVLLAHGADPNATSEAQGNVLHCAVRSGNAHLVRRLIEAGADPNYRTDFDETVFDALPDDFETRTAIVAVLKEYGIRAKLT